MGRHTAMNGKDLPDQREVWAERLRRVRKSQARTDTPVCGALPETLMSGSSWRSVASSAPLRIQISQSLPSFGGGNLRRQPGLTSFYRLNGVKTSWHGRSRTTSARSGSDLRRRRPVSVPWTVPTGIRSRQNWRRYSTTGAGHGEKC